MQPPAEGAKAGPALHGGMERKSSGCCEAPEKRGLSFSIEEILKRPAQRSDAVRPEGAGGQGTGQAAAADSGPERPPHDQPQGKCLLAISHLFLGLQDPAALGQRESCSISTEEKPSKFKKMLGTGLLALNTFLPSPALWLFQCGPSLGPLQDAGTWGSFL